jgi:hypothetical protein
VEQVPVGITPVAVLPLVEVYRGAGGTSRGFIPPVADSYYRPLLTIILLLQRLVFIKRVVKMLEALLQSRTTNDLKEIP